MTKHASESCSFCFETFHGTGWKMSQAREEAEGQRDSHENACRSNPAKAEYFRNRDAEEGV